MTEKTDDKDGRPGAAATTAQRVCAEHGNRPDALIEIFHAIQARLGHVPEDVLEPVAKAINRSRAEVYGVFSFYHDFRDRPAGRHVVKLCRAEACQAVGGEALAAEAEKILGIEFGATSADGRVTLESVYCLGNCALGPAALVDGTLHGSINNNKLSIILKKIS